MSKFVTVVILLLVLRLYNFCRVQCGIVAAPMSCKYKGLVGVFQDIYYYSYVKRNLKKYIFVT